MSVKRCPNCNAIIEFAQCEYRICNECKWQGSWIQLVDDPPIIVKSAVYYIFEEIKRERGRQTQLALGGNTANPDENKTQNDWIASICAYVGRAAQKVVCNKSESFRKNMIKVAALAVAAIETQDRLNSR